jgi:putative transcriptional regulator
LLFIFLAILGSPYQTWDYSDPEWTIVKTVWHGFEWIYFKVAPIIVIISILGIILIKRNK